MFSPTDRDKVFGGSKSSNNNNIVLKAWTTTQTSAVSEGSINSDLDVPFKSGFAPKMKQHGSMARRKGSKPRNEIIGIKEMDKLQRMKLRLQKFENANSQALKGL